MNTLFYPPSVDWEMTSACNHNCIHCYNYWRKQKGNLDIKHDKHYYMECAQKLIDAKPVSIQITGGEPFLVWPMIEDAIVMLLNAGINVSINTNATLTTDRIASFLAKNHIDAFVSFPCARHDIFDRIVNNNGAAARAEAGIKKLLDHGVRISLNMVVTKLNFPYIYETARYVYETFHVSYFSATKASFPQNADDSFRKQMLDPEEFNEMLQILLRIRNELGIRVDSAWVYSLCGFNDERVMNSFGFNRKCSCGRYSFVIDASGNIKACGCDSKHYGNILTDSFREAISRMSEWHDASLLAPECKTCVSLKYCGGGCRADACSTFGRTCALDSTANPSNCNRHIPERLTAINYEDGFTVELGRNTVLVQENRCVRISSRTNYEFISQQFANFIVKYREFNIAMLRTASSQDIDTIQQCIDRLLHKGLMNKSDAKVDYSDIGIGEFPLMTSPYIPEGAPQLICDYAGSANNSKRFY